jgi:flavin reductase (DIM6/NTAB) family NADH-FMN oxidoreductase RutF
MRGEFRAIESLRCEPNVGAGDFRRAMRCLVGAVTVVTSTDGQTPVGLSSFRTIAQSRRMAVNLLALDQSALALAFSRQGEAGERFDPAHWETLVTGAPVLRGALAVFDCVVDEMMVAHSHAMLIGEVKAARITDAQGLPLLYACGQFTTLRDECVPA